jgi:secreted trypsin-like serine protease
MRQIIIIALLGLMPAMAHAQQEAERASASDTNRARAEAAAAFATRLAPVDSEAFSEAFRRALDTALDRGEPAGHRGGRADTAHGNLDADPRFRANLQSMLTEGTQKIWGGQKVMSGAFPDTVAVLGQGGLCTGTLIAPDVVLTAAHCFWDGVNETVIVGDAVQGGATIKVKRSVPYIDRTKPLAGGDLALLFLATPTTVTPRHLAAAGWINAARSVHAVGFGRTESATEPLGIKREVDVPIATANCAGLVKTAFGDVQDAVYYGCASSRELVAGKPQLDRDTCNGDSGGGVFVRAPDGRLYLAAVTSRAVQRRDLRDCGDGGIYVRLDGEALNWIRSQNVNVTVGTIVADAATTPSIELFGVRREKDAMQWKGAVPANTTRAATRSAPADKVTTVDGVLQKKPDGTVQLVPRQPQAPAIELEDSPSVPTAALNLPLTLTLQEDAHGTHVTSFTLQALSNWDREKSRLSSPRFKATQDAFANLAAATEKAMQPGTLGGDTRLLAEKLDSTASALADAYAQTPPADALTRRELVRRYRDITTTQKQYGDNDVYPPETYDHIFQNSRGIAALGRPDEPTFCSGVLIAADLFLTAAHCLDKYAPGELEARFNYEIKDRALLPLDRYPVLDEFARGEPFPTAADAPLDYVILTLGRNADGKLPGEVWPKQCLSRQRVVSAEPLYVVGHPGGEARVVFDNTFVYFPFRLMGQQEKSRLRLRVETELANADDRDARLQEFESTYRPRQLGPLMVFENYSARWHNQPVIGANCDTRHGASGSPAYGRRKHTVVGILIEGEPDTLLFDVGWRHHEAILPMTAIVEQLDQLRPRWDKTADVCSS